MIEGTNVTYRTERTEQTDVPKRRVLFCRSGGGAPGLDIHAGISMALNELGIHSTSCAGTSAGAIISALDAFGFTSQAIFALINARSNSDFRERIFASRFRWPLFASHLLRHDPVADLLQQLFPGNGQALDKTLRIYTTRVRDGLPRVFSYTHAEPEIQRAVLASMSISGIFPYVSIRGDEYTDGGVCENLPLPEEWVNFDEVYLLIAAPPVFYDPKAGKGLTRLLRNLSWNMQDHINDVIATVEMTVARMKRNREHAPRVFVVRPQCGERAGMLRFDHALIREARRQTLEQIQVQREMMK